VNNIKIKGTSPISSVFIANDPIPTAVVEISNDSGIFSLDFNNQSGLYEFLGNELVITSGEYYVLSVTVGNRQASAETIVPIPPTGVILNDSLLNIPKLNLSLGLREKIRDLFFGERITIQWDAVPGQKYFVVIEDRVDEHDLILPEGVPAEAKELLSGFRFISEPSENSSFEIIGVALNTYGQHVAIVYSVNKEYVDLFRSLEQDSRDLNEPLSNINNAQGIFTAFASDSVIFEVRKPK
jgi:hypothetical protein